MPQKSGWYNEPRRHSLARKGVKTAERPYHPVFVASGQRWMPRGLGVATDLMFNAFVVENDSGGRIPVFLGKDVGLRMPQTLQSFETMLTKSGYEKAQFTELTMFSKVDGSPGHQSLKVFIHEDGKLAHAAEFELERSGETVLTPSQFSFRQSDNKAHLTLITKGTVHHLSRRL